MIPSDVDPGKRCGRWLHSFFEMDAHLHEDCQPSAKAQLQQSCYATLSSAAPPSLAV